MSSSDSQTMAKGRTPSECLHPPTLEVSKNGKEIPTRERQAVSTQSRLVSAGLLIRRWGNLELEASTQPVVICHLLSSGPPSGLPATLRLRAAPAVASPVPAHSPALLLLPDFSPTSGQHSKPKRACEDHSPTSACACCLTEEKTSTETLSHS